MLDSWERRDATGRWKRLLIARLRSDNKRSLHPSHIPVSTFPHLDLSPSHVWVSLSETLSPELLRHSPAGQSPSEVKLIWTHKTQGQSCISSGLMPPNKAFLSYHSTGFSSSHKKSITKRILDTLFLEKWQCLKEFSSNSIPQAAYPASIWWDPSNNGTRYQSLSLSVVKIRSSTAHWTWGSASRSTTKQQHWVRVLLTSLVLHTAELL